MNDPRYIFSWQVQPDLKFSWRVVQELKNELNADEARRNEILTGYPHPQHFIEFKNLNLEQLEQLVAENFIHLQEQQNNSPTTEEFLAFMRRFPEVKAHGYALPLEREDYSMSIEGLDYAGPVSDELEEAFDWVYMYKNEADDYINTPVRVYCWYD